MTDHELMSNEEVQQAVRDFVATIGRLDPGRVGEAAMGVALAEFVQSGKSRDEVVALLDGAYPELITFYATAKAAAQSNAPGGLS